MENGLSQAAAVVEDGRPPVSCVICQGTTIKTQEVEEAFGLNRDIIMVPVKTRVCAECGERYYDKRTLRLLEEVEEKVRRKAITQLEVVGKVMRVPREHVR
ncbi:MAG: YgiT-type zinc finger protein [Euryarchaeota archaeon]|nr:YgiT-type zinc finger protein [Euryarchaeota archaeon]